MYSVGAMGNAGVALHGRKVTVRCSVKANAKIFANDADKTIQHWCSYLDRVPDPDTSVKQHFAFMAPEFTSEHCAELNRREKSKLEKLETKYHQFADLTPSVHCLNDLSLSLCTSKWNGRNRRRRHSDRLASFEVVLTTLHC